MTWTGILLGSLGLLACEAEVGGQDPDGTGAGGTTGSSSGSGSGGTSSSSGGTSGSSGTSTGAGGSTSGGTSGSGSGGSSGSAGASGGAGGTSAGGSGGQQIPEGAYCDPTLTWDPAWAELEAEILVIVNQRRAEGANCGGDQMPPVGPLAMEPSLQCAARIHSLDMAERDFFDHDNPDGDGPPDRMEDAGYDGNNWGENIAAGNSTAEETMEQWMESDGHCSNIMNGEFTLIGVGYHPGGEYGHLWTQTFGAD